MKTPRKRRDGARPAVPPDVESRPTGAASRMRRSVDERRADCGLVAPSGLPKDLADAFAEFLEWSATEPFDHPSGRQVDVEPDPNAHQKRLASKAAYNKRRSADGAFRKKERERRKKWGRNNRDKIRAQKAKSRERNYLRPFVAIDSEGQDYPGNDILYQRVRYPRHDPYLWGAAADDGREPVWLTDAETHGMDKRPLAVEKILDWLLDLPRQFNEAVFVSFSFRYDIAQILKHLDYYTVWEIFKHETHPVKGAIKQIGPAPVLWKEYAIHYIDGKYIDIKRLANPENPSQGGRSKYSARIRIYDVFGFFGSSFSAVVDSMVQSGRATSDEAAFVREMKGQRENFGSKDIDQIKTYTAMELRLLARMMTDLRKGFDEIGLHLRHWHGAGAAAAALIEAKNLKAHYGPDIAASNIKPQQDAAHHAFYGGRIEMLKQGYIENIALHCYDIASAYPAGMVDLPSLGLDGGPREPAKDSKSELAAFLAWCATAEGKWVNRPGSDIPCGSLAELRKAIEATSPLSMFKIRFQLPTYEKFHPDAKKAVFIPFYPLPYRQKRGAILVPASGYGWYMRDHVLGAIAWLERFVADFPRPRDKLA